jgi:hypothetical protein
MNQLNNYYTMEESTKLILGAIISITILIVSVILKYAFSRKEELQRKKEEFKITAYSDFVQAIAGIKSNRKGSEENSRFTTLLIDSKTRISIFGSNEIILLIADLWRIGPTLDNPESMKKFVVIIKQMRQENFKTNSRKIKNKDISQLVFGEDVFTQ